MPGLLDAADGALDEIEDWQLVGDAYFSRRQLYALDWGGTAAASSGGSSGSFNLAFMRCAASPAPCGTTATRSTPVPWALWEPIEEVGPHCLAASPAPASPCWCPCRCLRTFPASACRVFPGPAGGPVAAVRDDTKLVLYVGAAARPDIQLFSAAGVPLGRVLWEPRSRVAAAGWTAAEQLLVVDDAAQVGRWSWGFAGGMRWFFWAVETGTGSIGRG